MKSFITCLIIIPFLISCEEEAVQNLELSEKLLGEWKSVSLKIKMNSVNNTDSSKIFAVDEKNWDSKMKMRPIHTIFKVNGTYNSEHFNLKDSLVFNPAGK